MFTSRRVLVVGLVLIGLSFAAFAGSLYSRLSELVTESDRGRRVVIGRRALAEATVLTAVAVAATTLAGWACYRHARVLTRAAVAARADRQLALDARVEALRRERQARDEAALASQFKDDFLATVSHELRTPLNAIVGWAHVLRRGMLTGPDRDRAIVSIDRNAAALTRIVNDLLDVSRLMQGQLSLSVAPLDLREIARAAADTLAPASTARNLTVTVRLDRDEVPVLADHARLQQVAWHLLSNAVKFTPPGGFINVDVSRLGSRARMRVSDSGEGIDSTALPAVFESFRQRKHPGRAGLGVGLAIVRHLVELHGGAVDVESPGPGRGSVFTITLPLGRRPAREGALAPSRRKRANFDTIA
jgi:signal transduction histidine kinase